jgi:hypothetical protein
MSGGKYYSAMMSFLPKTLTVQYRIGRVAIPVVGHLMAFEQQHQAARFAATAHTNGEAWAVLRCKAGVVLNEQRKRITIPNLVYKKGPHATSYAVRQYWKTPYDTFIMDSPFWTNVWEVSVGTVFCSWILPEEEVISNVGS